MTVTVHGTYGRLDHGENPFFTEIALGYGAYFYLTLNREQAKDKSRQVDRERAVLAFQYRESSGAEPSRISFLSSLVCFSPTAAIPDRII